MTLNRKTTMTCSAGEIRAKLKVRGNLPEGLADLIDEALHETNHLLADLAVSIQGNLDKLSGMDDVSEASDANPATEGTLSIGEAVYEYSLTFIGTDLNARQWQLVKEGYLEPGVARAMISIAQAHAKAVRTSAIKQHFMEPFQDLRDMLRARFGIGLTDDLYAA